MNAPTVIVDVDGTVALHGDRRSPYDWSRVSSDEPNMPVIRVVSALRDKGLQLVFVSGRSDVCKIDTITWLVEHVASVFTLHMRPHGDGRPDYELKLDIYKQLIEPNHDVVCVIDDRDSVVKMWRDLGLTCLQVAPGDF